MFARVQNIEEGQQYYYQYVRVWLFYFPESTGSVYHVRMMNVILYLQVLKTLLSVWSDGSALRHTSYEQHFYISQAIMVCLAFMDEVPFQQMKEGKCMVSFKQIIMNN